jgi:hypothetical protein
MKTTLLIIILTLGLLPGIVPQVEARHPSFQSRIHIGGYQRCGTPIYMVRYIVGYDCRGRAIWRSRHLSLAEMRRYRSSCHTPQHIGYGQSRISHTGSSGRGYTFHFSSGSPRRCASW